MVADKGSEAVEAGAPASMEAQRKEALRMRVLSQEWAGTAVQDLVNVVGDITSALSFGRATHATRQQLARALALVDRVRVAGEVAAASIRVSGDEGLELASDTARVESAVARDELDVQRLRRQLRRDAAVVLQRDQLEAAARVVLQLAAPRDLDARIAAARRDAASAQREMDRVDEAKAGVAREIALLLQCAGSAGEQAKRIEALLGDAGKAETAGDGGGGGGGGGGVDSGSKMDTSE